MPTEIVSAIYVSGALAAVAAAAALVHLWVCVRRRLSAPFRVRRPADAHAAAGNTTRHVPDPARKAPEVNDDGATFTVPSAVCTSTSPKSGLEYLRHRGCPQEQGIDRLVQQGDNILRQNKRDEVIWNSEPTQGFAPVKDSKGTNHVCPEGDGDQSRPSSSSWLSSACPMTRIDSVTSPHSAGLRFAHDPGSTANHNRVGPPLDTDALDCDFVTAFCPFGFGADDAPGHEDGDSRGSTAMLSSSIRSISSSSGAAAEAAAGQHCAWTEYQSRLVKLSHRIGDDSSGREAESTGQQLKASQRKVVLRTAPAQLSADEKAVEAAACQEQLAAILELMKKQDGVFGQEDIDGVTSQLDLYM